MAVEDNLICPVCGKAFHRKPYVIKRAKWKDGICCSRKCSNELRKEKYKGDKNHQYGLRGPKNSSFLIGNTKRRNHGVTEIMVYVGEWHKKSISGRVKEHIFLVEKNHSMFGEEKFDKIEDWYYLKQGYIVHHKDHDHSNNSIDNLAVLTKSEHTTLHNLANPKSRNSKGQFINKKYGTK